MVKIIVAEIDFVMQEHNSAFKIAIFNIIILDTIIKMTRFHSLPMS
jgi:hypothetical protein